MRNPIIMNPDMRGLVQVSMYMYVCVCVCCVCVVCVLCVCVLFLCVVYVFVSDVTVTPRNTRKARQIVIMMSSVTRHCEWQYVTLWRAISVQPCFSESVCVCVCVCDDVIHCRKPMKKLFRERVTQYITRATQLSERLDGQISQVN